LNDPSGTDQEVVVSLIRQLSWTHFIALLPIKNPLQRDFYAELCRVEGWSVSRLRLLVFGSAVGLLLGIAATRVVSSIVYQATPRDPPVLAGVVLAMLLLGLLATWIPAQRALGADPLMLLREE
jgi:hypothetical protein